MYTVVHVAAGDDLGKIWVYDVGEQLAVPQADEWNKFAHTLQVREGEGEVLHVSLVTVILSSLQIC